ncbi:TPM domain-containing protein [Lutimonas vermicola]|uniref:TPM domain-containing protein n=1 Tax=Lutimonas vermicola TaxID=414288 RepID=A0ABU9L271_9FLAO
MTFRKIFVILILIFVSCISTKAEAQTEKQKYEITLSEFPKQIGFVNDFENIFTEEQKDQLTKFLTYYKETSFREIAVITIDSIPENTDFDKYAMGMSDNWNVGKNSDGNGLTIVLSKSLRKVRISTTGITKNLYLSDEFCQKVIDENMIPEFKNENFYDGVLLGLNELIRKWI